MASKFKVGDLVTFTPPPPAADAPPAGVGAVPPPPAGKCRVEAVKKDDEGVVTYSLLSDDGKRAFDAAEGDLRPFGVPKPKKAAAHHAAPHHETHHTAPKHGGKK